MQDQILLAFIVCPLFTIFLQTLVAALEIADAHAPRRHNARLSRLLLFAVFIGLNAWIGFLQLYDALGLQHFVTRDEDKFYDVLMGH